MSVVPVVFGALGLILEKLFDTSSQHHKIIEWKNCKSELSLGWFAIIWKAFELILMLTVERPVESSKTPSRKSLPLPLKQQERQHHTGGRVSLY